MYIASKAMSSFRRVIIYKASAGSGKTYTIVQQFLKKLEENPKIYRDILAVTFTNNVAGEMKHRILEGIVELAKTKREFKEILEDLLKHYDRFAVQTIDSFIQRSVSNFLRSKYPNENYTIVLNSTPVLKKVLKNYFLKNKDIAIINNVTALWEKVLLDGKSWNLEGAIFSLFKSFHVELYSRSLEMSSEGLEAIREKNFFLQQKINQFEEKIASTASEIIEKIEGEKLKINDFAYGISGVVGYIHKLALKKMEEPSKRFQAALSGGQFWFSKKKSMEDYHSFVNEKLIPLALDIAFHFEEKFREYKSALLVEKNIFFAELMFGLQDYLQKYLKSSGVILLAENSKMFNILANNDSNFSKKAKIRYKEFFIDEFQDVSHSQWLCFKELLMKSSKDCPMELCVVGDPKQSIYRWRGSDFELMGRKIFENFDVVKERNLDTNWRSLPNITNFNNILFSAAHNIITQNLHKAIEDQELLEAKTFLREKIAKVETLYKGVHQKTKPGIHKNKGYLELKFFKPKNENEAKQEKWEKALCDTVELYENLQQEGFLSRDIVFIVRNNKEAKELFSAIKQREASSERKKYCDYNVISKASLSLKKNKTIKFILRTLEYLCGNKSENQIFEVMFFYDDSGNSGLKKDFLEKVRHLENFYGSSLTLIEKIIQIFGLEREESMKFIAKFLDVAREKFLKNTSLRDFLLWWQNDDEDIFVSLEDNDVSQILTIHQSKGLQYDVVVIPRLDWPLDHSPQSSPIIWSEHSKEEMLRNLPIKYSKELIKTDFVVDYFLEKINIYLDNLNLMYVALTRAKERMYIFAHAHKEENEDDSSVGNVLWLGAQYLKKEEKFFDFIKISDEKIAIGKKISREKIIKKRDNIEKFFPNKAKQENLNTSDKYTISQMRSLLYGNKMHVAFEKSHISKEYREIFEGNTLLQKSGKLRDIVEKFLKQTSLMSDGEEYIEFSEQSILLEDGGVVRIDKLLVSQSKAIILDLKTDPSGRDYSLQLKRYKEAVSKIYPEKQILTYIVNVNEA